MNYVVCYKIYMRSINKKKYCDFFDLNHDFFDLNYDLNHDFFDLHLLTFKIYKEIYKLLQ